MGRPCRKRAFWLAVFAGVLALALAVSSALAGIQSSSPASAQEETVELPVIMYHSLLRNPAAQGDYVISPDELEQDMCALQKQGFTPVHMEEVFRWQDGEGELPEKPVVLSFDDGNYNNYVYALPLAEKYQMKIIIAPIGKCVDTFTETGEENANYSYLTWGRIREMMDCGLVEFQNHTYDLHESKNGRLGAGRLWNESLADYQALLREDIGKIAGAFPAGNRLYAPGFCVPLRQNFRRRPGGNLGNGVPVRVYLRKPLQSNHQKGKSIWFWGASCGPHGISGEAFLEKTLGCSSFINPIL